MADVHTPEQRSRNMAAIKGRDTTPEMIVRRIVHSMGYRYGLHCRDLPGRPDLVLRKQRKIIFVHGCFWHVHDCRYGSPKPSTNADFWKKKRASNVERDKRVEQALIENGWGLLTVWECESKNPELLKTKLAHFLQKGMKKPKVLLG